MKTVTTLLLATMLACTAQASGLESATAGAEEVEELHRSCSAATVRGLYVFTATGFNVVNGAAQPKAIIERIQFNGDGTLVLASVTVSINGNIIRRTGTTGTYDVEADCTGSLMFSDGNFYDLVVTAGGGELSMIQTMQGGVPPGVTVGPVFQGKARRVSH